MSRAVYNQIFAAANNGKMASEQVEDIEMIVLGAKTEYEMLREFQTTFNSPCNDTPTVIPFCDSEDNDTEAVVKSVRWAMQMAKAESKRQGSQVMFRASLLLEEVAELLEATTLVDQLDALVDIHYINTGNFVEMGVEYHEPFSIVHNANMSKKWPDGLVHLDEFGKVIKPSTFYSPEPLLVKEIDRQRHSFQEAR